MIMMKTKLPTLTRFTRTQTKGVESTKHLSAILYMLLTMMTTGYRFHWQQVLRFLLLGKLSITTHMLNQLFGGR